jgi:molybdenum cofactor cytidylyltransferase
MNKTIKRNPKIALIILAAGSSKRMKAVKQLLPWRNTTLLEHVIETGVNFLGANYKNIEEQIDSANVTLINNPRWEEGMGTSISCSLAYLNTKSLIFDAILIALCDQPLIDVTYFNKLINNFIDKNINIVSSNLGVPAIFGLKYFKSLTELDQDIGARKIISSNKDDLFVVQEEKKLVDIDTEKDYNELFRKYGKL